jgi:hypothetical protein
MKTISPLALMSVLLLAPQVLQGADIDTVFRLNDPKGFSGQITTVSKTEVVVTQKVGNKEEHFPANEIGRVDFQGEPPVLGLARSNENSGNLAGAISGYEEALGAVGSGNANLKGEIEFLIARTLARMAQADASKTAAAIEKLNAFVNSHRDHYRFFPAQLLLAETALAANQATAADAAFDRLTQSPWPEYQMEGKIGMGRTLLAQNKVQDAKTIFDDVVNAKATTPAEKGRRLEAMLGQAECLQREKKADDATTVLQKVVDEATADDVRLLAQAYLQLGNAYSADGQHAKDAVLAYLHVDVIPSLAANSDIRAEALFNLSKLWPVIGQPARGAEASAKLQQEYPESQWTKKLAEGS